MITPAEAKEKALGSDFKNKGEILYYKMLISYLDHYLLTHYDGKNDLLIKLDSNILFKFNTKIDNNNINENMELKYEETGRFSHSFYSVQQTYHIPYWRLHAIMKRCIEEFSNSGWYINETSLCCYNFSTNKESKVIIFGCNISKLLNIFN